MCQNREAGAKVHGPKLAKAMCALISATIAIITDYENLCLASRVAAFSVYGPMIREIGEAVGGLAASYSGSMDLSEPTEALAKLAAAKFALEDEMDDALETLMEEEEDWPTGQFAQA